MEMNVKDGPLYVYGVIKAKTPHQFGPIGLGGKGAQVFTLHYKDLAIICSHSEELVCEPVQENITAHATVISKITDDLTIIPMGFGTVFKNKELALKLLSSAYSELIKILIKIEGKIELGLKVYLRKEVWDSEFERITKFDNEIKQLKKIYKENLSYNLALQVGQAVEQKVQALKEKYAERVYEELTPISVAAKLNELIGDRMVLNAAFLVNKARETEFDAKIQKISEDFNKIMEFSYTGPWPAYSFVDIKFKANTAMR